MQSSAHALALSLAERGHKVSFLCGLAPLYQRPSVTSVLRTIGRPEVRARLAIKLLHRKAFQDRSLGYPVWRARCVWESIEWVVDEIKPDVITLMVGQQVRIALALKHTEIPLLLKFQDVQFGNHGGSLAALGDIPCVANSQFTADRYRKAFGSQPKVIYPLINKETYRTETTRENITFINPHTDKGVDVAIAVARHCREIPFVFVESWGMTSGAERRELEGKLADVPNVKLLSAGVDMRKVYGKCRILIVPSRWEEAYGRVASEAQVSGIPVVASNRGGLPEAVGVGGILLNPDGRIEDWVSAVKRLWHDRAYYSMLSAAAYAHSERLFLNMTYQLDMWEDALIRAIELGRSGAPSHVLADVI
jgi:glycosyltransferase involved in cell wall biosynthesis